MLVYSSKLTRFISAGTSKKDKKIKSLVEALIDYIEYSMRGNNVQVGDDMFGYLQWNQDEKEPELRNKVVYCSYLVEQSLKSEGKFTKKLFEIKKVAKLKEKVSVFNSYFLLNSVKKENIIKKILRRFKTYLGQFKKDLKGRSKLFEDSKLFPPFEIKEEGVVFSSFSQGYIEWLLEDSQIRQKMRSFLYEITEVANITEELKKQGLKDSEVGMLQFYLNNFVELNWKQEEAVDQPIFFEKSCFKAVLWWIILIMDLKGNKAVKLVSGWMDFHDSRQLFSTEMTVYLENLKMCETKLKSFALKKNIDESEYNVLFKRNCGYLERLLFDEARTQRRKQMQEEQIKDFNASYVENYHPYNPYEGRFNGQYLKSLQLFR